MENVHIICLCLASYAPKLSKPFRQSNEPLNTDMVLQIEDNFESNLELNISFKLFRQKHKSLIYNLYNVCSYMLQSAQ